MAYFQCRRSHLFPPESRNYQPMRREGTKARQPRLRYLKNRSGKAHSALVCDEYGAFCGVVTLRDILDGLVGNCPDEIEEPMIVKRDSREEWLIEGKCPVYDFLSYFDREDLYVPQSYTTIGGMIMNNLQRVAAVGDLIVWNGFRIEVVDMDNTRVDKVAVSLETV